MGLHLPRMHLSCSQSPARQDTLGRDGDNTLLCLQLSRAGEKVTQEEEHPLLLLKIISEPLSGQ